jgi:nucleoid-associated protein YgaU
MECPVCHTDGLADDAVTCPHCHSDLEAFRLSGEIYKTSKNRLIFGYIASALFIIALIAWILTCLGSFNNEKKTDESIAKEEVTRLQKEVTQLKKSNETLVIENNKLTNKVNAKVKEEAKKESTYVVSEGETLYRIARKVYGNGYKYNEIARDNNIENPDLIVVGQKLIIYY